MQAGKVTASSNAAPGKLLVRGEVAGTSCLTTLTQWANSHCGEGGWQLGDLFVGKSFNCVGVKKQRLAQLQRMLGALCEQQLTGCRLPLYDVPAQVLAGVDILDTVGAVAHASLLTLPWQESVRQNGHSSTAGMLNVQWPVAPMCSARKLACGAKRRATPGQKY